MNLLASVSVHVWVACLRCRHFVKAGDLQFFFFFFFLLVMLYDRYTLYRQTSMTLLILPLNPPPVACLCLSFNHTQCFFFFFACLSLSLSLSLLQDCSSKLFSLSPHLTSQKCC